VQKKADHNRVEENTALHARTTDFDPNQQQHPSRFSEARSIAPQLSGSIKPYRATANVSQYASVQSIMGATDNR